MNGKCDVPSLASALLLWSWKDPPWVWAGAGFLSGFAIGLADPQNSLAVRQMRCGRGAQSSWALISQASSFSFCETSSGPRGRQLACLKMCLQRNLTRLNTLLPTAHSAHISCRLGLIDINKKICFHWQTTLLYSNWVWWNLTTNASKPKFQETHYKEKIFKWLV